MTNQPVTPVIIQAAKPFEIPGSVAQCPECGGALWVEVLEYSLPDRRATDVGIYTQCESEDDEDRDTWHRCEQSEWQPTYDRIYNWMYDNVRIAEEGEISR